MPEEQLKLMVKKLAWQKESKMFSTNQARQLLGTTLTETVERDRGVSYNTGVVAYNNTEVVTNTRVVSNTRACNVQTQKSGPAQEPGPA